MRRAEAARMAVIFWACVGAGAAAAADRPTPEFSSRTDAITVDVVVVDKDGRPVRGLTKDDFTVSEDGRPQTIVGFESRATPQTSATPVGTTTPGDVARSAQRGAGRTLAILLDDLSLDPTQTGPAAKKAVARWLTEQAGSDDEITLLTTSGDVWWADRADTGRDDLLAVLERVRGKKRAWPATEPMGEWDAFQIDEYGSPIQADVQIQQQQQQQTGPPNTGTIPSSFHPSGSGSREDRVVEQWFATGACVVGADPISAERECHARVRSRAREIMLGFQQHATALLGSVERLSRGYAAGRGRKTILVLSEGLLSDVDRPALDRAVDAAQRANAAVYFVDARGLVTGGQFTAASNAPVSAPDVGTELAATVSLAIAGTEHLAEETGGRSITSTNDLAGGVGDAVAESSSYYLLGYQPERPPDGKWRRLEVHVGRPGVTVRARRGYVAAPQAPPPAQPAVTKAAKGKPGARPIDPALMAGGTHGDLPLEMAVYALEADAERLTRVLVVFEIEAAGLGGAPGKAGFDLTILGASRDIPKTALVDQHLDLQRDAAPGARLVFSRELRMPPGIAQVRACLRESGTGRVGVAAQRLEVPAAEAPHLSTPILTNRAASEHAKLRLIPVASRRFAPHGVLYCRTELFGARPSPRGMPQVTAGYTLLDGEGTLVSRQPSAALGVPLDARMVSLFALELDRLAKGRYDLVLDVEDQVTGARYSAHEPFELADESAAAARSTE